MTVNYEIKGMLSKLLATEDIMIEHKKVDTACFNVHTRVLTLPMWNASNTVVDLLCAHEVGHARETPNIDWTVDYNVPPQYVNIVEDVRVEKLIKRRYAGLSKTFYYGYKELHEEDFFAIGNDDISTYSLPDRINLYFKIGNFISVEFSSIEKELVEKVDSCETFDDVLKVSEELYQYCKNFKEKEKIDDINENSESSTNNYGSASDFTDQPDGDNEQAEGNDSSKSLDQNQETEKNQESSPENTNTENSNNLKNGGNTNDENKDTEIKTIKSLEEALKNIADYSGGETSYIEVPDIDLKQVIIDNSIVHELCNDAWLEYEDEDVFEVMDKEFYQFKKTSQTEVNYLIKEFECRKSADSYARATTSRTGVLDCSKLHTYKYNEDIFRKITTLADGKNHGLIFILDWSGSMQQGLLDTVKQLFNLVWFCKKASIPFDVYSFTNDFPISYVRKNGFKIMRQLPYQKKEGVFEISGYFSLMNILTSSVNTKTLELQMLNIYRISSYYSSYSYNKINIPIGWTLSGTPLNESLLCLHKIIPKFQKEYKLQKVQCIILTDGESSGLNYHKEFKRRWDSEPIIGSNSIGPTSYLRDRKTGNVYSLKEVWKITDILLNNLRDNFKDTNFIGIRILQPYDASYFIRRYYSYPNADFDMIMNTWRKEKAFTIKNSGYHAYFGLSATVLSQDTEFAVSEDASKAQIKSAFVKSLKTKKMNKKILGEFIELIA